ncbi:aromatic ring-hydroxylating oxygenase subunit alpha [Hyalangium sp.]|uniref:aromatic ring-hydroxylating oxygenase subunit alpha n=1 Tax=Hyalangium sp. TaxID=2028555 RepID=UPI002D24B7F2|nr:SRPBCC family protein [Hyalangium sp.]HYI00399.1 SRPBCC family protein [Hyalangium sp.]
MEQAKQVELVRRVLEHLRTGTTHMVEEESRLPVAPYLQPERLEAEQRLFRKLPMIVGHASQLAEPGDYLTHDSMGTPLLLCRTASGEVTCFLNVCRHRGTRLVAEAQGRRKQAFVCPYHGWTYDSTGRLRAVPDEVGFPSRPSESVGLVRVPVVERLGLLWVTLEPGGPDVDTFLAPVMPDLAGFGLEKLVAYKPHTMERKLNWKIAIEIFLEAYHLRYAHRESIYPLFFNNVGLVDRLAPHIRAIFPKKTIQELGGQPEAGWELRKHANVLFQLFPNVLLLVQPDHVSVSTVHPLGADRTEYRTFWLLPQLPETEKATRYWEKNIEILIGAVQEDLAMGESIQSGLRSGANEFVRLARFEQGLRYFRDDLDAYLASSR